MNISHDDQYTFMIIPRSSLLIMRNLSHKICRGNQNTLYIPWFLSDIFRLWDNVGKQVEPNRPHITMRRMRCACWMSKATHTHTHTHSHTHTHKHTHTQSHTKHTLTHTHSHSHKHSHSHSHKHTLTHTHTYHTHNHTNTHSLTHTHKITLTLTQTHTHTHSHKHTHTHTHTHSHTHTLTHTHTHTNTICNTYSFLLQKWLHENASLLRYTCIASLVYFLRYVFFPIFRLCLFSL